MYNKAPKEVIEARPFATNAAQRIVEECNRAFRGNEGTMSLLVGSICYQNLITSAMVTKFEPGSKEGEETIRLLYESAIKDAVERWHSEDLKHFFSRKKTT